MHVEVTVNNKTHVAAETTEFTIGFLADKFSKALKTEGPKSLKLSLRDGSVLVLGTKLLENAEFLFVPSEDDPKPFKKLRKGGEYYDIL